MTLPHPDVCCRCAASGPTCCSLAGADEEFCFPISPTEMAAITGTHPFTPPADGDIFIQAANTPGFVAQMGTLFPDWDVETVFPASGAHWRLVTQKGHCIFLGETGCLLERQVRPLYCRLFPLWPQGGLLTWFAAPQCLATEECVTLSAMLGAMGMSGQEARQIFLQMCSALGLEKKTVKRT